MPTETQLDILLESEVEFKTFIPKDKYIIMENYTPSENTIPRRIRLDLNTPAELAIRNAMQEVEKSGSDPKLTDAIIHLQDALNSVADYVDEKK